MRKLIDKQIEKQVYGNKTARYFVDFVYECQENEAVGLFKKLFGNDSGTTKTTHRTFRSDAYFFNEQDAIAYAKYANHPAMRLYFSEKYDYLEKYYLTFDLGKVLDYPKFNKDQLKIEEIGYHAIYIINVETNDHIYFLYNDEPGCFGSSWQSIFGSNIGEKLSWRNWNRIKDTYHVYKSFDAVMSHVVESIKENSIYREKYISQIDEITKNNELQKIVVDTKKISIGVNNAENDNISFDDVHEDIREMLDGRNKLIHDEIDRIEKTKQFLLSLIR